MGPEVPVPPTVHCTVPIHCRYSGQFRRGARAGLGIELFSTGERYVGEYRADLREGAGTAYYSNGQVKYTGEWEGGSPHGNGTYTALNGDRYEGLFSRGVVTGPGTVYQVLSPVVECNSSTILLYCGQVTGDTRRVGRGGDQEGGGFHDLLSSLASWLGLDSVVTRYRTFYTNFIQPSLPG